jgi:hypothetical protein
MNTNKITKTLCEICKAATNNDHTAPDWFERLKDAENALKAVDNILSFNEYEREKGYPDNALEEMEYLDELAQCGGDWSKPSYILTRAFYGNRYSRFANEPGHKSEEFNPNDEYFTFNGYGNLVSVNEFDWANYWASILDESGYIEYAEREGHLEEIAEVLGIEEEDEGAE